MSGSVRMVWKKTSHKKDKGILRLAKCLVAAKDEMNINLFWDDREERFIRRYIEFAEDTSDDDRTCLN